MHILVFVVTILGAAAFWWYRMKSIAEAGSEVLDAAGHLRGSVRRSMLRKKAEESPVVAIDSPVVAAATLLINLVARHPMPPAQEEIVREQLSRIAEGEQLDEAIVYGRWVQTRGLDRRKATTMLCSKLDDWLDHDERGELINMVQALDSNRAIALQKDCTELAIRKLGE